MKFLSVLFACSLGLVCAAQKNEFGVAGNNLIYADSTIKQLKFIVDSLNLKFRVCNDNPVYRSLNQAGGDYIRIKGTDAAYALRDIEVGLGYKALKERYPKAEHAQGLWVVKEKGTDYGKEPVILFSSMDLSSKNGYSLFIRSAQDNYKRVKNTWIYKFSPRNQYSAASLEGFYMREDFKADLIAPAYARMIQYADCMIDTNYTVFRNQERDDYEYMYHSRNLPEAFSLTEYVEHAIDMPEYDYESYSKRSEEAQLLYRKEREQMRLHRLDSLGAMPGFRNLLQKAADSAMARKGTYTNDEFEELVERYYKPAYALEMKRRRRVIGGCSMDQSPRYHALAIAKLSAGTKAWEIFLRAHLDIMNDRFERVTDGSYAWQQRQTYIRELEVIDINVPDLLLGITLRCENAGPNHYYGSIGRLGRAMAETQQPEVMETAMLHIIGDPQLDLYNRMLMYFLFLNYNANLDDTARKKINEQKLNVLISTFPESLRTNAITAFRNE